MFFHNGPSRRNIGPVDRALYDILGVNPSSSDTELKRAYHKLAKEHHPDKNPQAGDKVMIKFSTAWHTWRKNYNPCNKDVTPQRTFEAYYDLYHGRISIQEFDPANAAIQKELSLKDGTPLRLEPAQRMAMLRKMRWGWKTLLDKF